MGSSQVQLKKFRVPDEHVLTKWVSKYQRYNSLPNHNLFLPASYRLQSNFLDCTDEKKIEISYPSYITTLKKYTEIMKLNKDSYPEEKLWVFLLRLCQSAADFEANRQRMGSIHPEQIYVAEKEKLLFSNVYTTPQLQGIKTLLPSGDCYYLAPQQLQSYRRGMLFGQKRSQTDSFSIGMTIVALATMNDLKQAYNLSNCTIDFSFLAQQLQQMAREYRNPFLTKTVSNMVHENADTRPTPGEIACMLQPYRQLILGQTKFKPDKEKSKTALLQYHKRMGLPNS